MDEYAVRENPLWVPLVINGVLIVTLIMLVVSMSIINRDSSKIEGLTSPNSESVGNSDSLRVDKVSDVKSNLDDVTPDVDDVAPDVTPVVTPVAPVISDVASDTFPEPVSSSLIDCVKDFECFVEVSIGCQKSKVSRDVILFDSGSISVLDIDMELKGLKNGKCNYYHDVVSLDVNLNAESIALLESQGLSESEIEAQRALAEKSVGESIGLEINCDFPNDELTAMLERWDFGQVDDGDWDVATCV